MSDKTSEVSTGQFVDELLAKLDQSRVSLKIANSTIHGDHQVELRDLKYGNSLIYRDWDFAADFHYNMTKQCEHYFKK